MRLSRLSSVAFVASLALLILGSIPASAACRTAAPHIAEDSTRHWLSAFERADVDALEATYANDAVVSSFDNRSPTSTPRELRSYLAALVHTYELAGEPMSTLRFGCGTILDFGLMIVKPRHGSDRSAIHLRYARVFEFRKGAWRVAFETAIDVQRLPQSRLSTPAWDRNAPRAPTPYPAMPVRSERNAAVRRSVPQRISGRRGRKLADTIFRDYE
ncbi:MAG: hypothetical protein AAGC70_00205 [Pseudomonadota bacterium]